MMRSIVVLTLPFVFTLIGCDAGNRSEELSSSPAAEADQEASSEISVTPEPSESDSAPTESPQADRPTPKSLPSNISLPAGAAVDTSASLSGGKHLVMAIFADEADQNRLMSRIAEELAKHGWQPKGEPKEENNGLSSNFETETEQLALSVYSGGSQAGLRAMLQLGPKPQ